MLQKRASVDSVLQCIGCGIFFPFLMREQFGLLKTVIRWRIEILQSSNSGQNLPPVLLGAKRLP